MSAPAAGAGEPLHLVVPGRLDQRTGGYLYDARIVAGLRARGRTVRVQELPGRFPDPDETARASLAGALGAVPDGGTAVVDGLAGGALPDVLRAQAGRIHLVALVHHPLGDETGLDDAARARLLEAERAGIRSCRGVVVTSRFTADRLRELGVPGERIHVVLPGTEPAAPARGPEPGAPPELLCVASITPRKGHDVLVAALARVRDRPWSCTLAGSAELAPSWASGIRAQVRDEGLAERVRFVGECDAGALDRLYGRATLFVLASRYEGYGMALAEAMARGLPVLSTTGGAIPHTVPPSAGLLVPRDDSAALAAALERLLPDRPGAPAERLARLAAGARAHAAALPTWDDAVAGFDAALAALAGEGAPA